LPLIISKLDAAVFSANHLPVLSCTHELCKQLLSRFTDLYQEDS